MLKESKKTRGFLITSFTLRVIYALCSSYLHPDEHLQGPQEIMHGSYGWASQTPWEFTIEHPLRSFVPLSLVYGIPASFFSAEIDPVYILYTLRILFAVLTWILEDMAVDRLATTRNDKIRSLFFVSTSYVTLTWQAHTLSNSLETILVLWSLVIIFEAESLTRLALQSPFDRHYDSALLAIIIVLGIFNRPTFVAFLLLPGLSLFKFWSRFPACLLTFAVFTGIATALCIYVDTFLYGSQHEWVITPLNFVKYNMSTENLSEHGIHSRLTHLLVNLPQLLGPGLLLLRPQWFSLSMKSVIGAIVILSIFPHQEARFLLPLAPLLCSQMDLDQFSSAKVRKVLLALWLAFNLVLSALMGVFHQAGVIPGQVKIRELEKPATVIWWKTYTPPLWVIGLQSENVKYAELSPYGQSLASIEELVKSRHSSIPGNITLTEIDLQGANIEVLRQLISQIPKDAQTFYLVAPMAKSRIIQSLFGHQQNVAPMWKTIFHIDPDIIDVNDPSSLRIGLGLWNISSFI